MVKDELGQAMARGERALDDMPRLLADKAERVYVVIEFLADLTFPRFRVSAGERYQLYSRGALAVPNPLDYFEGADTFEFAGGQCIRSQIAEMYRGLDKMIARVLSENEGLSIEEAKQRIAKAGEAEPIKYPSAAALDEAVARQELACPICGDMGPLAPQSETLSLPKRAIYEAIGVACRPCAARSIARVAAYQAPVQAYSIARSTYEAYLPKQGVAIRPEQIEVCRQKAIEETTRAIKAHDSRVVSDRLFMQATLAGAEHTRGIRLCYSIEIKEAARLVVKYEEISYLLNNGSKLSPVDWNTLSQEVLDSESMKDILRGQVDRLLVSKWDLAEGRKTRSTQDQQAIDLLTDQVRREEHSLSLLQWIADQLFSDNELARVTRILRATRAEDTDMSTWLRGEHTIKGSDSMIGKTSYDPAVAAVYDGDSITYSRDGLTCKACIVWKAHVLTGVKICPLCGTSFPPPIKCPACHYTGCHHHACSLAETTAPSRVLIGDKVYGGNASPLISKPLGYRLPPLAQEAVATIVDRGIVALPLTLNKERLVYARESAGLTPKQAQHAVALLAVEGGTSKAGAPRKLLDVARVEREGTATLWQSEALHTVYGLRPGWLLETGPMPGRHGSMERINDMLEKPLA